MIRTPYIDVPCIYVWAAHPRRPAPVFLNFGTLVAWLKAKNRQGSWRPPSRNVFHGSSEFFFFFFHAASLARRIFGISLSISSPYRFSMVLRFPIFFLVIFFSISEHPRNRTRNVRGFAVCYTRDIRLRASGYCSGEDALRKPAGVEGHLTTTIDSYAEVDDFMMSRFKNVWTDGNVAKMDHRFYCGYSIHTHAEIATLDIIDDNWNVNNHNRLITMSATLKILNWSLGELSESHSPILTRKPAFSDDCSSITSDRMVELNFGVKKNGWKRIKFKGRK